MGEFTDFGKKETPTKGATKPKSSDGVFNRFLDLLSRAQFASAGSAKELVGAITGKRPLFEPQKTFSPIVKGLTGKEKTSFRDVAQEAGVRNKLAVETVGTFGDVFGDPTTYLGLGAGKTLLRQGPQAVKSATGILGPLAGEKVVPARIARAAADQPPVVNKLLAALESARPIRAEQQALFSAERSKRIATATKIGAETPGEAGFIARKAALAGELPKAKFQPLQLAQTEINELFDIVAKNPRLTSWQVIQTQGGLHRLIRGGSVPQPSQLELLGRVFGSDIASYIAAKAGKPVTGKITALAGLTRGLMTFLDYSAPFRQGLAASTRHPILAAKSFAPMIRSSLSKNAYKTIVDEIASRPTFDAMQRGRVALSALSDVGLSREEAFAAAQLAERIPVVGRFVSASNRAYSAFLTKLRADVFDSIVKGGPKPLSKMTTEELRAVGTWVNTVTGRGDLGRLAPAANLLTTTIFAPRLIASRLSLINPRFYLQAARNPILRKEALTQAAALYGSIATVLGGAKAAGAKVETDWRSSDFGKISIPAKKGAATATIRIIPAVFGVGTQTFGAPEGPRTRFEITGGLQPYIRLIGQLYTGEAISPTTGEPRTVRGRPVSRGELLQQFIEAKYSPVASAVRDILYKDLRPEDYNVIDQIVSRMTPMILQDWYELTQGGEETLGEAVDRRLRGQGTDTSGTGEFSNF